MDKSRKEKRKRRHARVRAKMSGTAGTPRLAVFRSNRHIYAQLIDDENGRTLAASSDGAVALGKKRTMKELAKLVGEDLAKKAKAKKVAKAVFDRGGFNYKGNIEALANGAREGGLVF